MQASDVMTAALSKAMNKSSNNVVVTAVMLGIKYGPMLDTTHLAELLKVKESTIVQNISREDFDIPVTKIGKVWYATAYNVAEYLERNEVAF